MTTTHAAPPPPPPLPEPIDEPAPSMLPRAGSRTDNGTGTAPLRGNNARLMQVGLFMAGAVLMPIGIVVICLGWYGIAHTPYQYNQLVYIVSGGLLGLGITFVGGFLYFAAWIARVGTDLKESDKRLADALFLLAESTSHSSAGAASALSETGSVLVVAGSSSTVHRADCPLLEGRSDIHPASSEAGLTACRLCRPEE